MQLAVAERAGAAIFRLPEDCGLVTRRGLEVAIETALRGVQLRAQEPLDEGWPVFEQRVPGRSQREVLDLAPPEALRLVDALAVKALVLFVRTDARPLTELWRRLDAASS